MTNPLLKSTLTFLKDLVIIVGSALLISFVIKTFLFRSFYIPSASMEDTLLINDRIIVNELVPDVFPLENGDVVVFADPGGWLSMAPKSEPDILTQVIDSIFTFADWAVPIPKNTLSSDSSVCPVTTSSAVHHRVSLRSTGNPSTSPTSSCRRLIPRRAAWSLTSSSPISRCG